MILAEFSMTPLDKGESVSTYVARSLDIIDRSGLPYRLGPMGTCVEGSWDEVFGVIRDCFNRMQEDCGRISISMKVDFRKGKSGRLDSKIKTVESKVGRSLKT
ncbi:MAG TPA: MTH1187 family thiamine-binding protein [Thermoanaerobaculia bacterium]|nr:MTH1187 family thiamine-binding protein [Thermoanaerobaculia bacterium]HUM28509.1 MTH1187 family thiamine-binding protein [Thermoanaerobaculia bacterium]HXK66883.1 MTH1187 family thiamine-binding protein [Thermoanaerobaculia bacterium]